MKPIATPESTNSQMGLVNSHQQTGKDGLYFRIIPINLHSKTRKISTFAFLDDGSSVTLMDHSLFNKLKLSGTREPLCLQWTGNTTRCEKNSIVCSFKISALQSNVLIDVNDVRTVENLQLPRQSVDTPYIKQNFRHTSSLPMHSYFNAEQLILIGANNWKLAVPLKICEGS